MTATISPGLVKRLCSAAADDLVEVVIEFEPSDDAESLWGDPEAERAAFARRSAPARALVAEMGGNVTHDLWSGDALGVSVPARLVVDLISVTGVALLDVERALTCDGRGSD